MGKIRTAKAVVEGVVFLCGNCGENLCEPNSGSHLWTVEDAERMAGRAVTCDTCDETSRLPSTIKPRMP